MLLLSLGNSAIPSLVVRESCLPLNLFLGWWGREAGVGLSLVTQAIKNLPAVQETQV